MKNSKNISRRQAVKFMGLSVLAAASATVIPGCANGKSKDANAVMTLRKDSKAGNAVSLLGFGCMRFPTYLDENNKKVIDMEKSQKLVDYAIAHGVNYFDTAYNYHRGASEAAIGTMLKKYPRESFYLASKMPSWLASSQEKAKEIFQEQLDRAQVEYFDYYLLHSLGSQEAYDKTYEEGGVLEYLLSEKAAGRIKRLGFSFHGSVDFFKYLLEKREWDFVQVQLNYADWDDNRAGELYKMLEEKNIPCIVMEPLLGGALAKLTADAEEILKDEKPDASIASWAFRYVGSLPGVLTVLSGMTEMDHLVDNIKTYSDFQPLTEKERGALANAYAEYKKFKRIPCTKCNYCMPCKFGVDIPLVFATYNKCVLESNIPDMSNKEDKKFAKKSRAFLNTYRTEITPEAAAEKCISCGKCTKLCPQKLDIPGYMTSIKNMVAEIQK